MIQSDDQFRENAADVGNPSTDGEATMASDGGTLNSKQDRGDQMLPAKVRAEVFRLFHGEHFTMNGIAEALGIHHDTVKRILKTKNFAKARAERASQLDPYIAFIEEVLRDYPGIRSTRIFQMIKDRGYKGKIGILRQRVAEIRPQPKQAFLPMSTLPAEQAQVDWAHFKSLEIENTTRKLYLFVMVLSWSRAMYAKFCLSMEQAVFHHCHILAFQFLGGVPRGLVYDNLKSVVIERHLQDINFNDNHLEFSSWYRFKNIVAAPRAGWQKGRVERAIRYIRENFFPARQFKDLADANQQLWQWLDETANVRSWPDDRSRFVKDLWLQEKPKLMPLPQTHPTTEVIVDTKSGKVPWVRYDTNNYSIPFELVGKPVTIRATEQKVRVIHEGKQVAEHERSYGKGRKIRDNDHFSRLLEQRSIGSKSTLQSLLVDLIPEAQELIQIMIELGLPLGPNCRKILVLIENHGKDLVQSAIKTAIDKKMPRPNTIAQILAQEEQKRGRRPSLPIKLPDHPGVKGLTSQSHDLTTYDDLVSTPGGSTDDT